MKKTFNLRSHILRTAFYDDSRGLMEVQTRALQNCYKQEGNTQEGCAKCREKFNKAEDKGKWALDYSATDDKIKERESAKTPSAQKIK